MKDVLRPYGRYLWLAAFAAATLVSYLVGFEPGKDIFVNFRVSLVEMITFVPFIFIIVGLFDAWVPKEQIQRHVGKDSGIKGMALMVVLAMLQAGPLYGAFPVVYLLYRKGASIRNIFIFLGAFSSLKIPMLGIEIGYLGIEFTLVRTLVSLPLFIAIGFLMERLLGKGHFEVSDGAPKKETPKPA